MEAMAQQKLLKNKSYLYLISAQLVSQLGDWLDILALLTLVGLKWGVSPMEMSFVIVFMALPQIIFGPFSGVLADRFERKNLMIVSDIVRFVLVLGFVFASSMWQIYAILFLKGMFGTLFFPAKNGKLKEIVPDEQMHQASGISAMIDQGTKIAGPAVGGLLVAMFDVTTAFYIDAATFILSALLLLFVPKGHAQKHNEEKKKSSAISELKEGLAFLVKSRLLMYTTFIMAIVLLVLQLADSQFAVLFREMKNAPSDVLGYAIGGSGLGGFIAAAFLSKVKVKSPILVIAIGTFGMGLGFAFAGWATQAELANAWIWFPLGAILVGAFASMVFVPFQAAAQKEIPVELSGRVFGSISSITTLAVILGPVLGGAFATGFTVMLTFILSGSLLALIGIFVMIGRSRIERRDQVGSESNGRAQGAATS